MGKKLTQIEFIKRATDLFGDLFDYTKVDYKGIDSHVTIGCRIHGEFTQTPYRHLKSKKGCPKCSIKAAAEAKTKSTEEFVERAKLIHGDKYDYTITEYTAAKEKVTITCPAHGEFTQLASGHLSGYGCPVCSSNGKGRVLMDKPCKLYYFNIKGTSIYKLGTTSQKINHRYRTSFDRSQIGEIFIKEFTTGREAYEAEQQLHSEFSEYRYTGPYLLSNGNTELFSSDIFQGNYEYFT